MLFRRPRLRELEPARRALADGEYDTAFTLLESAARRPVGRAAQAEYLLHLAALYALYGDDGRENGEWVLREALASDPALGDHPLYLALYWSFAAMRGEAPHDARRALRSVAQQGDPVADYHAADALVRTGAVKPAARILERLDDLPDYLVWRRWSLLGQIHETLGRWEPAVAAYRRAVDACRGPEREAERLSLAGCLLEVDAADEAADVLEASDDAVLTGHELADKRYLEGRCEMDRGNPNRALERYLASLELEDAAPPYDVLFATAQCLVTLGRNDEGADTFAEALADAPADQRSLTHHERALALTDAERWDEAESAFAAVVGDPHYPHRAEAYADLADLRLRVGDLAGAEQLARQALDQGAVGAASLTLGSVALEYFHFDEATEHLEQAAASVPVGDVLWLTAQQMLADVFSQRGPEYAARALHHAEAALAYTDAASEWYVVLEQILTTARTQQGERPRVLN